MPTASSHAYFIISADENERYDNIELIAMMIWEHLSQSAFRPSVFDNEIGNDYNKWHHFALGWVRPKKIAD